MTKSRNLLLTEKKAKKPTKQNETFYFNGFCSFFKLDILVISFEYTPDISSCIFQTAFCERKKSHGTT